MAKITQTAGRNALGEFAPQFAHFNDDVLFGENWNNEMIRLVYVLRTRKNTIAVRIFGRLTVCLVQ